MNNKTLEHRLDEAKAVFWQRVLANDLLTQLVIDEVTQQVENGQKAHSDLPGITGQLMLIGDTMNVFALQLKMSQAYSTLGGVVGMTFATMRYVEVMTYCEDINSERALLTVRGSYCLVASEALWSLDAGLREKAEAMLAYFKAWLEFEKVVIEVDAHYDRLHGFTTSEYNYVVE